jgi:stage II sporulation protein D
MARRLIPLVALAAALAAGSAAAGTRAPACAGTCFTAPAGSGALLLFSGHGYGHGVGMSQYGAYGYAQHGSTFEQILAHYYPGTTLGPAPVSKIRVLLVDRRESLKLFSEVPFTVRDGTGRRHTVAAGTVSFGPGLRLAVDGDPARQQLTAPLTFTAGKGAPLTLTRPYRGQIQVDVVDGKLRAIDIVGLEQYLYGVVPSEMPSTWAPEALKAQAVAARSYALATRQVAAPFDVFSDTRSQMYLGVSNESQAATAAVDLTKGQVLFYGGTIAKTFFSSTSGGRTESSQDWTGTPLPYLVSVADPYDSISPYHDWGPVPVTARTVSKKLKVRGTILDATTVPNPAGRVASLNVLTALDQVQIPGTKLRTALGLRSTWFSIDLLSLAAPSPNPPVAYGTTVTLGGAIRGLTGVMLEERPTGGTWEAVGPVAPGTLQLTQKPASTTDYRLATATAVAGSVRIRVAPAVTVTSLTSTQVVGSELPLLPGAPVAVQQQSAGTVWTTVATGSVAADGTFAIPVTLTSGGTYRVSVAPGAGYAPGSSAPQIVVP